MKNEFIYFISAVVRSNYSAARTSSLKEQEI